MTEQPPAKTRKRQGRIYERKRADGKISFQVKIRRGGPVVTRTFDTRQEAKTWIREQEHLIDKRDVEAHAALKNVTLGRILERFQKEVTPTRKGHVQEKSRINGLLNFTFPTREELLAQKRSLDDLVLPGKRMADIKLSDLKKKHIKAFKSAREHVVSGTTVNHDMSVLSAILNYAIGHWDYEALENCVEGVPRPKWNKARERRFHPGEYERFIQEARNRVQAPWLEHAIVISVETGMRQGELLDLLWEKVDLGTRIAKLVNTKTDEDRDVPISLESLAAFQALRKIFPQSAKVLDLKPSYLRDSWEAIRSEVGSDDLTWHDMRHEAVSRFFEQSMTREQVMKIVGHKTYAMVNRYNQVRGDHLLKALDQAKAAFRAANGQKVLIAPLRAGLLAMGIEASVVDGVFKGVETDEPSGGASVSPAA
jgi:integrase